MKIATGSATLLNCVANVLGPLNTLHAPVPMAGVLAASVAVPLAQIFWLPPAFDAVGGAFTVIVTFDVDGVHGALLIVQVRT